MRNKGIRVTQINILTASVSLISFSSFIRSSFSLSRCAASIFQCWTFCTSSMFFCLKTWISSSGAAISNWDSFERTFYYFCWSKAIFYCIVRTRQSEWVPLACDSLYYSIQLSLSVCCVPTTNIVNDCITQERKNNTAKNYWRNTILNYFLTCSRPQIYKYSTNSRLTFSFFLFFNGFCLQNTYVYTPLRKENILAMSSNF